jgi:hypothetical protein
MQLVDVHKHEHKGKLELNAEEVPGSLGVASSGLAQPLTSVF